MKILITGKNSYIGNSVEKYLQKKANDFAAILMEKVRKAIKI